MIGNRYGKWLVVEEADRGRHGQHYWCVCDCGTRKSILKNELVVGNTKGCMDCKFSQSVKPENMIGTIFGNWKVIRQSETERMGRHYDCMCKCGSIHMVRGDILRQGRSKQCANCRKIEVDQVENAIIGTKIGRWTVLKRINFDGKQKMFECRCECGRIDSVQGSRLFKGRTMGCRVCAVRKHGLEGTTTYNTWRCMIARCTNPNHENYIYYGAKGVRVCERWRTFKNFVEDMGEKPKGLQLDRIDPFGNYEPGNCRWVTAKENANNKRRHQK